MVIIYKRKGDRYARALDSYHELYPLVGQALEVWVPTEEVDMEKQEVHADYYSGELIEVKGNYLVFKKVDEDEDPSYLEVSSGAEVEVTQTKDGEFLHLWKETFEEAVKQGIPMRSNNVHIERERDTITVNIREGNQTRFFDCDLKTARELLYKLQAVDLEG